jgi:nucleoside-diphosphate-sugar epimerase
VRHFYNQQMSINNSRALSRGFRKPRLLIIGCGDIGLRVAQLLTLKFHIIALTSSPGRLPAFRAAGIRALVGNLDDAACMPMLQRLAAQTHYVLHLAPPQNTGTVDLRTQRLIKALRTGVQTPKPHWVYMSTTGVYGDHSGAFIDETARLKPQTARAVRRVDAEQQMRAVGAQNRAHVTVLRVPGIYDAQVRSPRERLLKGTPALREEDDVFTNHIHADDLARICVAALLRGKPQRVINANDDTQMKMGDYFDVAADAMKLPRAPRISRAEAELALSPMQMSFMSESRRLLNHRLHTELRVKLCVPSVQECFNHIDEI